jgi:hypothetical protein
MVSSKILKENALIRIKAPGVIGNTRKVRVTDAMVEEATGPLPETMRDEERTAIRAEARKRLAATKKLVVCPELDEAKAAIANGKARILRTYCNPSFIDEGFYLVRLDRVGAMEAEITRVNEQIRAAVNRFADVLPREIERSRAALGAAFSPADYPNPDTLRAHPGLVYNIVHFDVPEGLPPELREAEEKKLREAFERARQQIIAALRTEFAGLVEHLRERLEPGPGGQPKKFQRSTVDNLKLFIKAFGNRDAFGDTKLRALVEQARAIIEPLGDDAAEKLRNSEVVRERTAQAFAALKAGVDKGIAEIPARGFEFGEE